MYVTMIVWSVLALFCLSPASSMMQAEDSNMRRIAEQAVALGMHDADFQWTAVVSNVKSEDVHAQLLTLVDDVVLVGNEQMMLLLQTQRGEELSLLQQRKARVAHVLRRLGLRAVWYATVSGQVSTASLSNGADERLMAQVRALFAASSLQTYRDGRTINETFATAMLCGGEWSGGKRVQLQAEVHRHSETGELRLSLGAPLLATVW